MIICIDFDGTIVKHKFPEIGDPVPFAFNWMRLFQQEGAQLILWTMRADRRVSFDPINYPEVPGDPSTRRYLSEAVEFCYQNGIQFWGINSNPEQFTWSDSPKCYGHLYIDDAAFGCPLVIEEGERPYADWKQIGPAVGVMIREENRRKCE